ncbi:unnamed protein product, partial [Ascophyllum nodosum]
GEGESENSTGQPSPAHSRLLSSQETVKQRGKGLGTKTGGYVGP